MEMSEPTVREQAIKVIKNRDRYSASDLYKAVFDLYHNSKEGDEELLYPLIEHEDNWVAAGALYGLFEVYGYSKELRRLVLRLADGDSRDVGDHQLQFTALSLLVKLAKEGDREAEDKLWEVAYNSNMPSSVTCEAWYRVAEVHGIEWKQGWTEQLVDDSFGQAANEIREHIQQEILRRGGWVPRHNSHGNGAN